HPAVTTRPASSDTFAGIKPSSVPGLHRVPTRWRGGRRRADRWLVSRHPRRRRRRRRPTCGGPSVSYEHGLAVLSNSAVRIAKQFEGIFAVETAERLLHESDDMLAATARVSTYLPLLTERFAADRLR